MNPSEQLFKLINETCDDNTQAISTFLDNNPNVDINTQRNYEQTPLYEAMKCHINVVRLLIERGADVNIKTRTDYTPLQLATLIGRKDIVELLFEHGADVSINNKDKYGDTPLHCAAKRGHFDIVHLLLDHGADIDAKNENGYEPIYYATRRNRFNVVKLMLEYGADVNINNKKDKYDNTLLHIASSRGYVDIVRLLIEHGADVNVKNNKEQTPYDLAIKYHFNDVAQLLIDSMKQHITTS